MGGIVRLVRFVVLFYFHTLINKIFLRSIFVNILNTKFYSVKYFMHHIIVSKFSLEILKNSIQFETIISECFGSFKFLEKVEIRWLFVTNDFFLAFVLMLNCLFAPFDLAFPHHYPDFHARLELSKIFES